MWLFMIWAIIFQGFLLYKIATNLEKNPKKTGQKYWWFYKALKLSLLFQTKKHIFYSEDKQIQV